MRIFQSCCSTHWLTLFQVQNTLNANKSLFARKQNFPQLDLKCISEILCKPLILKRDISGVFMTQSKCWSPGLLIVSTESLMLPDYKSRGILSFAWAAKVFCTFLCLQFLALWFTLKNFTASFNLNFQLNNAINRKIEESRPPPKFHST